MRRRKKAKKERGRGIYILPNLMTTASMFLGFLAIVSSIDGRFETAALAILVAGLFDALDGRIARLTNTESSFGVELDSLADLISFGVAPALLAYLWALSPFGRFGWLAAFLYTACGALRLARFNVQKAATDSSFFKGLPIPAAAYMIATTVLFANYMNIEGQGQIALLVMVYVLSFLMVSTFRYISFKNMDFLRRKSFNTLVAAILLFIVVAAKPYIMMMVIMLAFVVSGPVVTYVQLRQRRRERAQKSMARDVRMEESVPKQ